MKRRHTITLCVAALLVAAVIFYACSKKADRKFDAANSSANTERRGKLGSAIQARVVDSCGSCNRYFNGTHAGTGFYIYPDIPLNLSCAVDNSTVSLGCTYYDVPNRFTIYDKNGNVVVTTGWIGWAHCSGPWGFSVTTPNVETFVSFTYSLSLAPYKLRVETKVTGGCGGCSNDAGCVDADDNWQVYLTCVQPACDPAIDPDCHPEPPECEDCYKYFSATHAGIGFYLYPDYTLNLCSIENSPVTIGCTYYDVPNRFTIYDKNGNVASTTGWIGWAHCTGPWGSSVTTPNAETFMTFTFHLSLAPYKLRVETNVVGCGSCSSDAGCTDQDDNWLLHINCVTQ